MEHIIVSQISLKSALEHGVYQCTETRLSKVHENSANTIYTF